MRPVQNQSGELARAEADDPVFEVLLHETLQGTTPPDQSDVILRELAEIERQARAPQVRLQTETLGRDAAARGRSRGRGQWLVGSTLIAVAASLLWAFGPSLLRSLVPSPPTGPKLASEATPQPAAPDRIGAATRAPHQEPHDQETSPAAADQGAPPASPRRGVPLEMRDVPFGDQLAGREGSAAAASAVPAPLALPAAPPRDDSEAIVRHIDTELAAAWDALSLPGAEPAAANDVVERFAQTVAVSVTPEDYGSAARLATRLTSAPQHRRLAEGLVEELLGPSAAKRLDPPRRQALAGWVGAAFTGNIGFDEVVASLYLGGENERAKRASQAWLTVLAGGQSVPVTEQTAHALLDLDLRCGRCHDHPIEGGIAQQDYWQFAALFENALYYTRSDAGQPEVRRRAADVDAQEGLFFELPDGRQRVALPGVPASWLGGSPDRTLAHLPELAASWIDNPQLAKSTINRLWKIVYGRPLVGAASDPQAPPRDQHLIELRDYLAAQLRAHDFNLATATAWILAAEPMRLQVAGPLRGPELLTASEETRLAAIDQTRAFAAFRPRARPVAASSLLALADRWNGGTTLDQLPNDATLAQPIDQGSSRPRPTGANPRAKQGPDRWLRASFPTISNVSGGRPELPAQWLASLDSFEQQARHLYYAAGYWQPSAAQLKTAETLRQTTEDADLALSQLWWVIENSQP